jgi:multiple sugar transport system substrate-binding protein
MAPTAMTRRAFLATLAGGAAAGLAGCAFLGGGRSPDPNAVTFANWSDSVDATYAQILEQFLDQTGVRVDPQASVSFDDYQTRFRTLLAGGSPPDVMRLNDDFLREMSDKQQLLDVNPLLARTDTSALYPELLDFTDLPAGRGGLAIGSSPRVIYYNKTVFDAAGIHPPRTWSPDGWTWDDFLAAAREVTTPDRYGAIVNPDTGYENTFSVNNGGAGIFSEDGRSFTLADPAGFEAIQWVADLTLVHEVQPSWAQMLPDNANLNYFASGRAAMLFANMGTTSFLNENVTDFEWDIAPIPARAQQRQEGSNVVFVIPRESRNPDQAWRLLSFLAGQQVGELFASTGSYVPINSVGAQQVTAGAKGGQNVALFAEAVNHTAPVNSTTATSQAVELYRPQLDGVYTGETTAEAALTGVRARVEEVLRRR